MKLPPFYEECLKSFAKCSAANCISLHYQNSGRDLSKAIVWKNKDICIEGKSVYFRSQKKTILRTGNLISDNYEFIVKCNYRLRELNISLLDIFRRYFCSRSHTC